MTFTDFNYESSYLPGLTCNMDVRAHIGTSTGRSTPCKYWHLVVKNGNFTFLLLESILADQWADLPLHFSAMHHGISIMGCIWQPLWILQEKVGICFHF